ncbi:NADH-ubiquinone/plastoquinone oxidoreductase [Archangium violaceum]|uniref:complex I subunit 5 family protein n=1 Tax=Archangium violaceum TaxID=83451 RepID=UPI00193C1E8B|nr:proton-conducting transporter membrane subunit [Archangium violaceum]QRK05916.1 NADH-ubiquinone/plastoquinone oxidoreductase [Archangium violaceum]
MSLMLVVLGGPWVLAGVLAFLDGRRPGVGWTAAVGLAGVLAACAALVPEAASAHPPEFVTGKWPVGVGIRMRADMLSAVFCGVSVAVLLAALVFELLRGVRTRTFPALVLFLAAGLNGAFLTGDAFNFYVFFELSMTAAFALASYGGDPAHVRAAFTFVMVNLVGSVLFLSAVVMLYQLTGTLDMGGVSEWTRTEGARPLDVPGALLLSALGVKVGLFPFHFWAPAVYRDTGPTVAALLAGALANLGSYGLLRFGGDVLPPMLEYGKEVLAVLGGVSIVYGSLLALSRRDAREVLAYASIAQAGLLLVALGVGGARGLAAAVALALVGSVDKAALFLALGEEGRPSRAAFAVAAFSTAGVPLSAGFVAKAALLRAALGTGQAVLAGLVVLSSALSLLALFRTWQHEPGEEARHRWATGVWVLVLALTVVAAGAWPEPLLRASELAASGLGGAR